VNRLHYGAVAAGAGPWGVTYVNLADDPRKR